MVARNNIAAMTQRSFGIFNMRFPECKASQLTTLVLSAYFLRNNFLPECVQGNRSSLAGLRLGGGEPVTKILVAEDNPADVYLLREAFQVATDDVEC